MQSTLSQQTQISSKDETRNCLGWIIFFVLILWIITVSALRLTFVFSASSSLVFLSSKFLILFSLAQAFLIGLPTIPLALWWKGSHFKSIFKTLAFTPLFTLLLLPVQFAYVTAFQTRAILQIILCLLFGILVYLSSRKKQIHTSEVEVQSNEIITNIPIILTFTVGACAALPWLAWGALGSILDTILSVLVSLAIGTAAGLLFDRVLFPAFYDRIKTSWQDYVVLSLSVAVTLLIMASSMGFSFGGTDILLSISLPPLGGVLVGLYYLRRPLSSWRIIALSIGLVAMAPIALIDPDELALIISLGQGEILQWALLAAMVTGLITFFASLITFISLVQKPDRPLEGKQNRKLYRSLFISSGIVTLFIIGTGILIYFFFGQPGLYGERIFVIMKDQADLSATSNIANVKEKRNFVYKTLVSHATTTQKDIRQVLDRLGLDYTPYYLVNGLEVGGNPILRLWLKSRPEVDRILDNPQMRPLPKPPSGLKGNEAAPTETLWNLRVINADRVWNEFGVIGNGIVVGQPDSGVQGDHPELIENYRGKGGYNDYNWYDPWYGTSQPTDIFGHGTHTLGTIVGKTVGIAPGATWIGCTNLGRNMGNPAFYLDCLQFLLAPFPLNGNSFTQGDPGQAADVLNGSWACPEIEGCDPDSLEPAMKALRAAGIFVEASAGNDGPFCNTISDAPAIYDSVFTTGAIDQLGNLAFFSSLGPVSVDGSNRVKPDLVAPGVDILSSLPGGTYGQESGTSMAGPHTVGVVALMWSANPGLIGDIDRTEQILHQIAKPFTGALPQCPGADSIPSTAVGYGILDAYEAVKAAIQEK